jgi:hypothetical protein
MERGVSMTMYGIYSMSAGRILEGGFYGEAVALREIGRRVDVDGANPDDLEVEELCDDHPSEAACSCPRC